MAGRNSLVEAAIRDAVFWRTAYTLITTIVFELQSRTYGQPVVWDELRAALLRQEDAAIDRLLYFQVMQLNDERAKELTKEVLEHWVERTDGLVNPLFPGATAWQGAVVEEARAMLREALRKAFPRAVEIEAEDRRS